MKFTPQDFKVMKPFEELAKEINETLPDVQHSYKASEISFIRCFILEEIARANEEKDPEFASKIKQANIDWQLENNDYELKKYEI